MRQGDLLVIPRPGSRRRKKTGSKKALYEVARDFNTEVTVKDHTHDIWVPSGFQYDGASIPKAGWIPIYTPFHPDVMIAAAVHDWLYQVHHLRIGGREEKISRCLADRILLELMRASSIPKKKRAIVFGAVTAWGCTAWRNHSRWDCEHIKDLYMLYKDDERFAFPPWARPEQDCPKKTGSKKDCPKRRSQK